MSTARIGGITVDYDDIGAGTPLVLVHGHPFDRSMWRPQTERFGADGWRVIAAGSARVRRQHGGARGDAAGGLRQ